VSWYVRLSAIVILSLINAAMAKHWFEAPRWAVIMWTIAATQYMIRNADRQYAKNGGGK